MFLGSERSELVLYWKNKLLKTEEPPEELMLTLLGEEGYELVTVVYSEKQRKWLTYLKKIIDPALVIKTEDLTSNKVDGSHSSDDAVPPPQDMDDIPF
jgi:hypothetical protein